MSYRVICDSTVQYQFQFGKFPSLLINKYDEINHINNSGK